MHKEAECAKIEQGLNTNQTSAGLPPPSRRLTLLPIAYGG